jgi:hypothetical protein
MGRHSRERGRSVTVSTKVCRPSSVLPSSSSSKDGLFAKPFCGRSSVNAEWPVVREADPRPTGLARIASRFPLGSIRIIFSILLPNNDRETVSWD